LGDRHQLVGEDRLEVGRADLEREVGAGLLHLELRRAPHLAGDVERGADAAARVERLRDAHRGVPGIALAEGEVRERVSALTPALATVTTTAEEVPPDRVEHGCQGTVVPEL